jgi:DNA adenine methylase
MLDISARPGGRCLIPFAGAGSECVACAAAGIDFLGFEIEPEYFRIGRQRLAAGPARAGGPVPSLVKWTGSKRSQADAIRQEIPDFRCYFEPFLGSGAVLFTVAGSPSVGGDVYGPLIELWKLAQSDAESLAADYQRQWRVLQAQLPEYYYEVRTRFNASPNPLDLNFLLRTCVNGIVRFNEKGEFNNSFHLSRPGMHPDRFRAVVAAWHDAIRRTRFTCADFEQTLEDARADDFVYLDPPYRGTRQRYSADLEIDRLWRVLDGLNTRGVRWALSFDGKRGDRDLRADVPAALFRRHVFLRSGNSPVGKVLNGPVEMVQESLYLNY